MRITYDKKADAVYIHLTDSTSSIAKTVPDADMTMNFDFDSNGHLIGIEVLGATKLLPSEFLKTAEQLS